MIPLISPSLRPAHVLPCLPGVRQLSPFLVANLTVEGNAVGLEEQSRLPVRGGRRLDVDVATRDHSAGVHLFLTLSVHVSR